MSLFKTHLYFFLFLKLLILAKTCYGESYLSYKIYIGNNKPIAEIGSVYGQKLGFLNQNNNPGGSGNSRSNTETFSISNDFQIGIKSYKTITYNSYLMLDFGLDMALGSTTLFFEDGIGIFVESINCKVAFIKLHLLRCVPNDRLYPVDRTIGNLFLFRLHYNHHTYWFLSL